MLFVVVCFVLFFVLFVSCVFFMQKLFCFLRLVQIIASIHTIKPQADILLPEDYTIDLKPHLSLHSTITLLGLTKLVKSPTRITPASAAPIDPFLYIYIDR